MEKLEEIIRDGYILFEKNGIIDSEKAPEYGSITLKFQNSKLVMIDKTITRK